MVRSLREHARTTGGVVLLALLALSASTAVPHADDCHGAACADALVPHSADSHRIDTPSSHDTHQHCAVCHWVRSLRPQTHTGGFTFVLTERAFRVHSVTFVAPLVFPAAQPPLRSPPLSVPL